MIRGKRQACKQACASACAARCMAAIDAHCERMRASYGNAVCRHRHGWSGCPSTSKRVLGHASPRTLMPLRGVPAEGHVASAYLYTCVCAGKGVCARQLTWPMDLARLLHMCAKHRWRPMMIVYGCRSVLCMHELLLGRLLALLVREAQRCGTRMHWEKHASQRMES